LTRCQFASATGFWADNTTWRSSSAECPLAQLIPPRPDDHFHPADPTLVAALSKGSLFLIGDSTDRNKVNSFCDQLNVKATSYIPGLHLSKAHGNSGYAACTVKGGFTIGQFMHYGVMDPPYLSYAYPIPEGLQGDAYQHLALDATRFRARTKGADPTLVVVQSYAWDLATLCERRCGLKAAASPECTKMHGPLKVDLNDWTRRVTRFLAHVQRVFPKSKILWRTSHVYFEYCGGLDLLHAMNDAARTSLPRAGVGLAEWGPMMEKHPDCYGRLHVATADCNLPYVNRLLNEVARIVLSQPRDSHNHTTTATATARWTHHNSTPA
jgi:hypothetical protein